MSIRANCQTCGKVVKAGDDWAGRAGKCPGCGAKISFAATPLPPPPPPNLPSDFDDVIAEEQRVANIMASVDTRSTTPPSPPPIREPLTTNVVKHYAMGVEKVVVTKINLTIGNMMQLILTFWAATFLIWLIFFGICLCLLILLGGVGAVLRSLP